MRSRIQMVMMLAFIAVALSSVTTLNASGAGIWRISNNRGVLVEATRGGPGPACIPDWPCVNGEG